MHTKRFVTAIVLAFVFAASAADQAAGQEPRDSLLVVVAHEAEDAGLIRVSFGEGNIAADSLRVIADSVQYGEFVPALVYFDRERPTLYFHLYEYQLQEGFTYGIDTAEVIEAGHTFTLVVPESIPVWLNAVYDDGTTLKIRFVLVESVDPDRPGVIDGDIRLYPNPAKAQARIAFDVRYPVDVELQVVDVLGRVVTRDGYRATMGENEYDVDLGGLGPGVYFIRLTALDGQSYAARIAPVVVGT